MVMPHRQCKLCTTSVTTYGAVRFFQKWTPVGCGARGFPLVVWKELRKFENPRPERDFLFQIHNVGDVRIYSWIGPRILPLPSKTPLFWTLRTSSPFTKTTRYKTSSPEKQSNQFLWILHTRLFEVIDRAVFAKISWL